MARAKKKKTSGKSRAKKKAAKRDVGGGPLQLEKKTRIETLPMLIERLGELCDEPDRVSIDAASVESIDTASLQVLAAFANTRRNKSRSVEWSAPSEVFCETVRLLDLTCVLQITAVPDEEEAELCPVF